MIGILVQLVISWILLRYVEKQNLNALGFAPWAPRLGEFLLGVLAAILLCLVHALTKNHLQQATWQLNPDYTVTAFLSALGFCFRSVFFEELIFRGALCYIGFQRIGAKFTMLISSIAFGIYHWFSFGILGDVKMMIIVFAMTGLYGWTLAYAYYKTKSIMLGSGLHLGWLIVSLVIFSGGTIGNQWLLPANTPISLSGNSQTIFFFAQVAGIPLLQYALVHIVLKLGLHRAKD
jgi:uncharacterized protein